MPSRPLCLECSSSNTCILMAHVPLASNTKLPPPGKNFPAHPSGAQGRLTLLPSLGGDPETSADRLFFGSRYPPMGSVPWLSPDAATDTERHWGSRSLMGTRGGPAAVLCWRKGLCGLSSPAILLGFPSMTFRTSFPLFLSLLI